MKIDIYDNQGKTFDRYTIFIGRDVFGMSANPLSPLGFNQYVGDYPEQIQKGKHLGKRLNTIPKELEKAINLKY